MGYMERYRLWRTEAFDEETRAELAALKDEKEIEDRFYRDLEFGTGGLRGVMGAGTNRMNRYIIRKATQGLADWLKVSGEELARKGVAIAYDSRNNSAEFAKEAALTLCANGVRAFLFEDLQPTPLLSFAVRHLECAAGVVVTASHNPKEYNGYKVYNEGGCQLVPREAEEVIRYVNAVDLAAVSTMDESEALDSGLLTMVGKETVDAFSDAVAGQAHELSEETKSDLRIVYSPLHGSGNLPVRAVLERLGYMDVRVVAAQEKPDGNFSTVRSPNPEDRAALELGIAQAEKCEADIVLGTDPDCDRVGVAIRAADGGYQLLTGNQIGALLVHYVLNRRKDTLSERSTLVKTVVTSELGAEIAKSFGLRIVDTLTGFKFIGEQICNYEKDNSAEFVIGYEESYGYLVGTHARDKDAVVSSLLICEMAAYYKAQRKTLLDVLAELYETYGYYLDALDSFTLKGKDGAEKIQRVMAELRKNGAKLDASVESVLDYSTGLDGLPKSDVLKFRLKEGSWLAVRPSGTEPKIKIYYSIRQEDRQAAQSVLLGWQETMKRLIEG